MLYNLSSQLKFKLKKFSYFFNLVLGITLLTSLNACNNSKSKSKSTPPPVPYNFYNGNYGGALCPNCGMNVSWSIFAGTDSSNASGSMTLSLDFYGDPSRGFNFYDPKIPLMYSGYVVVRGQLTIGQIDPFTCNIPPGQYQVISLSAGQWQGGVVTSAYSGYGPTGLYMQAVSPQGVTVGLRLAKGVIYNPTGTTSWYPNRLGGAVVFDTVNGARCYSNAYTEVY